MIIEVEGDILLSRAAAIAHGVAANDPMTQGLAKSLHERLPAMHKAFHHWCHQQHPQPGDGWLWTSDDGIRIVNLITQEGGYGHGARPGKAKAKYVSQALRTLKKLVHKEALPSLALPCLATGIGGLTQDDVRPLIDQQLGDLVIPVYLYVNYVPGQRARE